MSAAQNRPRRAQANPDYTKQNYAADAADDANAADEDEEAPAPVEPAKAKAKTKSAPRPQTPDPDRARPAFDTFDEITTLDTNLCHKGSMLHAKCMAKILAIYFDVSGPVMQPGSSSPRFSVADKSKYMKTQVFDISDTELGKLKGLLGTGLAVDGRVPDDKLETATAAIYSLIENDRLTSEMSVVEWVHSWVHYAYLPYRKQRSYFLDGEAFAMGCLRCSRPFYEYEQRFESYLYTLRDFRFNKKVRPASWPQQQWECNAGETPRPFHGCEHRFEPVELDWRKHPSSKDRESAPVGGTSADVEATPDTWRFAGWPVYYFNMSDADLERRSRGKKSDPYGGFREAYKHSRPTFRRVFNSLYEHRYPNQDRASMGNVRVQGRVAGGSSRVPVHSMDYRTIRAAKMTNVCSDCQKSLDLAGHMFMRRTKSDLSTGSKKSQRGAVEKQLVKLSSAEDMGCDRVLLGAKITVDSNEDDIEHWEGCMQTIREKMEADQGISKDIRYGKTVAPEVSQMVSLSEERSRQDWEDAIVQLTKLSESLRKTSACPDGFVWTHPLKQLILGLLRKEQHTISNANVRKDPKAFDSQFVRHEHRGMDLLKVTWYDMDRLSASGSVLSTPRTTLYPAKSSMWAGDPTCRNLGEGAASSEIPCRQQRPMKQTRLFVTYALHKPLTDQANARIIMERMADAARLIFGSDRIMESLLVFGFKYDAAGSLSVDDHQGKGGWVQIKATKKAEAMSGFYGNGTDTSYVYDTFETHVESIETDVGVEIGPRRKHPHMHILLTINHFTYIQFDTAKFAGYLEVMFKGLTPPNGLWAADSKLFFLPDVSGGPYYDDSENPYLDVKLYPQDDWQDVISAYVRKGSMTSVVKNIASRDVASA